MTPRARAFRQVDVFTQQAYQGNGLAVVMDGSGLSQAQMQAFAQWTQLSETTFLLPPTAPEAHYQVRIFTPGGELPFAGHPTLGSCHAWLEAGGVDGAVDVRSLSGRLRPAEPRPVAGDLHRDPRDHRDHRGARIAAVPGRA